MEVAGVPLTLLMAGVDTFEMGAEGGSRPGVRRAVVGVEDMEAPVVSC